MSLSVDLRIVELMAARLCHDLIGPVAAIGNGVELMAEEAPDFVGEAIALVGDSARKANKRLQFYRFAYGFSGGGLTGPPPHVLAVDFFAESAIVCDYGAAARILPLDQQKLACAMLAVAGEALPRGGRLALEVEAAGLAVEAAGEGRGPGREIRAALQLGVPVGELNSRAVGGYFAGLLGAALGWRLDVADRPGGFRLAAAAL